MLFIYVLFYVDLTFAVSFDNIVSCWRRLLTTITFSCVFSSFSVIESFILLFFASSNDLISYTCVFLSSYSIEVFFHSKCIISRNHSACDYLDLVPIWKALRCIPSWRRRACFLCSNWIYDPLPCCQNSKWLFPNEIRMFATFRFVSLTTPYSYSGLAQQSITWV